MYHEKKRILLADDEASIRLSLNRVLTRSGYNVIEAKDGQETHELLLGSATSPIDLILLDLHMPKMDGLEVLDSIMKANLAIKVITMTGGTDKATVAALKERGCDRYIEKPFDKTELLKMVKETLTKPKTD